MHGFEEAAVLRRGELISPVRPPGNQRDQVEKHVNTVVPLAIRKTFEYEGICRFRPTDTYWSTRGWVLAHSPVFNEK